MKNFVTATVACTMLFAAGLSGAASHTAAPVAGAPADVKAMHDDKNRPMHHDPAMHAHDKANMMDMMKKMDTNGDKLISKKEFMTFHEQMFDAMPKSASGLVDPNNVATMEKKK